MKVIVFSFTLRLSPAVCYCSFAYHLVYVLGYIRPPAASKKSSPAIYYEINFGVSTVVVNVVNEDTASLVGRDGQTIAHAGCELP